MKIMSYRKRMAKGITCSLLAMTMVAGIFNPSKAAAAEWAKDSLLVDSTKQLVSSVIGRYSLGTPNEDGGQVEIVTYNHKAGYAYAISGTTGELITIPMTKDKLSAFDLTGNKINMEKAVGNIEGFVYGDMTSIAINSDCSLLAVAIQAKDLDANGKVAIFEINSDGSIELSKVSYVDAGKQPDNIAFTPDDKYILTADEGEPRNGLGGGAVDPKGSVTIIDVEAKKSVIADFSAFSAEELAAKGIMLSKIGETINAPEFDLEPEYIAINKSSTKAYISLQENNAIAVVDIKSKKIENVFALGYKDWSSTKIYLDGTPKTYENTVGAYMPDGIDIYEANGKTYILTANEGDGREWGEEDTASYYCNELKIKVGEVTKVRAIDQGVTAGVPEGKNVLFGGRSFSMFEVTSNGLKLSYDSGSEFEDKTMEILPEYFNCSNDSVEKNDRSKKKGPEAETVVKGTIDGKVYAFTGLERVGGIMVYDITNPGSVKYVTYINSRDYSGDYKGDVAPEGLKFVPASNSPTGKSLLLVGCEVSGTMPVYSFSTSTEGEEEKPEQPKPEVTPGEGPNDKPNTEGGQEKPEQPKPEVTPSDKPNEKPTPEGGQENPEVIPSEKPNEKPNPEPSDKPTVNPTTKPDVDPTVTPVPQPEDKPESVPDTGDVERNIAATSIVAAISLGAIIFLTIKLRKSTQK